MRTAELEPAPDGTRRQKSKGGFKTRREAERAFGEFRDQLRTGTYVPRSKGTLGELLVNEWLPAINASVRPTTLDHYERNITVHLLPTIGSPRLQDVSAAKLNASYAEPLKSGRCRGGGLSPKTVRHVHTTLHKALHDAVPARSA